jgi:enolase
VYYSLNTLSDSFFQIAQIYAREIIDSRGNPTVEVEITTEAGGWGRAAVPSGASVGINEALELRDGDENRYFGKGVLKAVRNVNEVIAPELIGSDVRDQQDIDDIMIELDGTENKSRLGANAILGVSLANARCCADLLGLPLFKHIGGERSRILPIPMMNLINGGKHAGNDLAIQEFMVLPVGAPLYSEALRMGIEVYKSLHGVLKSSYGIHATSLGDEGGYSPPMSNTMQALKALQAAINKTDYVLGKDLYLGMDSAASNFYSSKKRVYNIDGDSLDVTEMINFYEVIVNEYNVRLLEDPLYEEDFEGFAQLTERLDDNVLIVGDDLFVTNVKRLTHGISMGACNALLLKVNQIGTLTEAMDAAEIAFDNDYSIVVSHRSGETTDDFISNLAVGLNAPFIKTGAPARGERTSKYNELLRIEEILGDKGVYAGLSFLS